MYRVVPSIIKSRISDTTFSYQVSLLWSQLRLHLKCAFLIKLAVHTRADDPSPAFSYTAKMSGCWELLMMHCFFINHGRWLPLPESGFFLLKGGFFVPTVVKCLLVAGSVIVSF